jgi:hypothetical protein
VVSYAAFFAAVIGLAIGAIAVFVGPVPVVDAKQLETTTSQRRRARLVLVGGAIAASLAMALFTAMWLVPQVSKHLSSKELYGKTKQLDPSAPIGQYHFNAQGASYYSGGKAPVTLGSLDDLFKFLARPEHVFVMAGAEELPSIDQYAKQHAAPYFVVDDTSARYLMISNRLGPGERDLNPLRLYVSDKPPTPAHPLSINFDNKVELIGWDAPPMIGAHQEFRLKLYYKVNAPLPGSYKVFVHIDGAGTRINGDHIPLDGKFPTNYWVVGSYITDEHTIKPSDNNTGTAPNSGYYQVYMGMFLGTERLKVLSGPSDGDNRARLGGITIK